MKRIVFISVAMGAVLLLLSLPSLGLIGADGPLQVTITPTAFIYLPFTAKEPTPTPMPTCPPADGEGTVPPAVAIYSIIFVVNDVEQVVRDDDALQASSGDSVWVREVTTCVKPFEGSGGQVYVEFDPVDQNGQIIKPEVRDTQSVGVTSGFTSIPGPDYTWNIGDNWRHISVVSVHYPPGGGTQDPDCEDGACEVDDRVIVRIE